MKLTDEQITKALEEAKAKPEWARTPIRGNNEALRLQVKAGHTVITSEGVFEFEMDGDWMMIPSALWVRTLQRARLVEPRMTGKGDGGSKKRRN